jgi:hypothetical protein
MTAILLSFKGSANQRFNKRPPIGESVLSITSSSVTAFDYNCDTIQDSNRKSIHPYISIFGNTLNRSIYVVPLLCCVSDR